MVAGMRMVMTGLVQQMRGVSESVGYMKRGALDCICQQALCRKTLNLSCVMDAVVLYSDVTVTEVSVTIGSFSCFRACSQNCEQ
jgi:hypothetical protein